MIVPGPPCARRTDVTRPTDAVRVTLRSASTPRGGTTPQTDETSRNIGSACLPLRAARPSGGLVQRNARPCCQRKSNVPLDLLSTDCGQGCGHRVYRVRRVTRRPPVSHCLSAGCLVDTSSSTPVGFSPNTTASRSSTLLRAPQTLRHSPCPAAFVESVKPTHTSHSHDLVHAPRQSLVDNRGVPCSPATRESDPISQGRRKSSERRGI